MLDNYYLTPLEKELEALLQVKGIKEPSDLSIENVSKVFDINVYYFSEGVEEAIWNERNIIIFLNQNNPLPVMRDVFFHELGHPLRHYGNQLNTPKEFRKLQESQANHVQLYVSMPFYMIQTLDIPPYYDGFIDLLASVFHVTPALAKKRVDQIQRRLYQRRIDNHVIEFQKNKYREYDPSNWSNETKQIMNQLYSQIGR